MLQNMAQTPKPFVQTARLVALNNDPFLLCFPKCCNTEKLNNNHTKLILIKLLLFSLYISEVIHLLSSSSRVEKTNNVLSLILDCLMVNFSLH
jgi:hypothetical protein